MLINLLASGKQGSSDKLLWDIENRNWFGYWNNYCDSRLNQVRNETKWLFAKGKTLIT